MRIAAIDRVRAGVIALVVLHHAVLAYCSFGRVEAGRYWLSTAPVVDGARWGGFDALVRLDDGFFMPLLFLVSGVFVAPGVARRGAGGYVRARVWRLGVPLVAAELLLVPLAYYPGWVQAGGVPGLGRFWAGTVLSGAWPSGPPWFLGVLLGFDVVAAAVMGFGARWGAGRAGWAPAGPGLLAWVFAASVAAYAAALPLFGPARWVALGPLAVQASRSGVFGVYFAAGVVLGSGDVAAFGRRLAAGWWRYAALAAAAAGAFLWAGPGSAVAYPAYCAAMSFAVLAAAFRGTAPPGPVWRSLAANGFAIYLLHYPVVAWVQFAMLGAGWPAAAKAGTAFAAGLGGSWALAACLRWRPRPGAR